MKNYSYVQPTNDGRIMEVVNTEARCINLAKLIAEKQGHKYDSDQDALEDYITVHWASETSLAPGIYYHKSPA